MPFWEPEEPPITRSSMPSPLVSGEKRTFWPSAVSSSVTAASVDASLVPLGMGPEINQVLASND